MSLVEQGPTASSHDSEPLLYETASRRPRKRARQETASAHHVSSGKHSVTRKQVRGRRGALKNLLEMPDDMMWEASPLTFSKELDCNLLLGLCTIRTIRSPASCKDYEGPTQFAAKPIFCSCVAEMQR